MPSRPSSSIPDPMRDILSTAQALKSLVNRAAPTTKSPLTSKLPSPLSTCLKLHPSPRLQAALSDTTLPVEVINLVSQSFVRLASHYRQQYEAACQLLPSDRGTPGLQSLDTRLGQLRNALQMRFKAHDEPKLLKIFDSFRGSSAGNEERRPRFNHDSIPMLEKFFEVNQLPSRQERQALARKTNMTSKQIAVWFQNHRSRSRKDGQTRPVSSPPPDSRTARPSSTCQRFSPSPQSHDQILSGDDQSAFSTPDSLASSSALSTSPPLVLQLSLPRQASDVDFSCLSWPRRPATQPATRAELDVEELASLFESKLSLKERKERRRISSPDYSPPLRQLSAWRCPSRVIPSSAPLPSLVSTSPPSCPSSPKRFRATRLLHDSSRPFSPYSRAQSGNLFLIENAEHLLQTARRELNKTSLRPRPTRRTPYPTLPQPRLLLGTA